MGAIDYWCNAFDPAKQALWEATIAEQGVPLKIRSGEDGFAEPDVMLKRMDELGISTLLLPTADPVEQVDLRHYECFCTTAPALIEMAIQHPGRFAGLWTIDPTQGMSGVQRAAEAVSDPAFVGLLLHTHSWDLPFDDRALYPFYALAADHDVPIVVQAGASGGLMPSECGKPIGIDRPAIYFDAVRFVLSHTGWPWVDEAIAMASKHKNVHLGTAAWPPHHWPEVLLSFIRRTGRGKVLWGTSFPTVGHRHAFDRLAALGLDEEVRAELLETTARTVFTRLRPHR